MAVATLAFSSFGPDISVECLPARGTLSHARPPAPRGEFPDFDRYCWDKGRRRLHNLRGVVAVAIVLGLWAVVAAKSRSFSFAVGLQAALAGSLVLIWLLSPFQ